MLKTIENQKILKLSDAIKLALFSTSLMLPFSLMADSDSIQINDIDNRFIQAIPDDEKTAIESLEEGNFDLTNDESSSIVSATTGPVQGNAPGIRTIALVNNGKDKLVRGKLSMCSTVTVNYQILDIDGDWDPVKDSNWTSEGLRIQNADETYWHKKTSDTIVWKLTDENNNVMLLGKEDADGFFKSDETGIIRNGRLSFKIPTTINFNGEVRTTKGLKLSYEITPWTMYGSFPRTLGEPVDSPLSDEYLSELNRSDVVIEVNDITQGMRLAPEQAKDGASKAKEIPSDAFKSNDDFAIAEINYEGLPASVFEKNAFITENVIVEGECLPVDLDKIEIKIFEINPKDPNQLTEVTNSKYYVNREYKAQVSVYNPITEAYEDKTEQLKDFVTWGLYEVQDNQMIDRVKFMTAKGIMDVPSTDEELKLFDPRTASFKDNTSVSSHFRTDDNTIFKTQTTNSDSVDLLQDKRPNFSEQSLKLRVDLVLPSVEIELLF